MESEFIIAYVQSSQVSSMDGYAWQNQEITRKELAEAYDTICAEYPIDRDEIIDRAIAHIRSG